MSSDARDQDLDKGFTSVGQGLEELTLSLFGGLQIEPDEAEAAPEVKAKKTSLTSAKLTKAAAAIAARPDKAERAYLAREFVLCTLPHRDPGKVSAWVRQNGNYALALQPGINMKTKEPYGLPYGSIPRLILLWIATEAVSKKNRRVRLGKNLTKFLEKIGLDQSTGRGPRGDATRLKEQMTRLFNCRISFEYSEGDELKGRVTRLNMEVANKVQYWWDFKSPDQDTLFESEILLGEDFFNALVASPVPLDMRALIALKQSPLAIDLYMWINHRTHSLRKAGRSEVTIPIDLINEQFGAEYSRQRDFKAAFAEALEKVKEVCPTLDYTIEKSALILRAGKSAPAIAPRDQPHRNPILDRVNQISPKTRQWFVETFPRHSHKIEKAEAAFKEWREDQGVEAQNINALFRKFARTWATNNPPENRF